MKEEFQSIQLATALGAPEGFLKSEFGDIFESFIKDFVLHHPLPYEHLMAEADIAIIRSDDTDWSIYGGFSGRGLFGSLEVKGDFKSRSVFDVFHLISHGKTPKQGISFFLPEYDYPSARYQRNEETLKTLPLYEGVHEKNLTHVHPLFFPMRNVLVFDEYVDSATLGNPELIFLAGSRASDTLP